MHILLTDVLACPRCGPAFGLILLADRVEERRVLEGFLGCANCREEYPVRRGEIDLRFPARVGSGFGQDSAASADERALRVAALLGARTSGEWVLLVGFGADFAKKVSVLLPEIEVIALAAEPSDSGKEVPGVSRVAAGPDLPFQPGKLHGVALASGTGAAGIAHLAGVLAPAGRLLIEEPAPGAIEQLRDAGLQILLEDPGALLAARPGVARPTARS